MPLAVGWRCATRSRVKWSTCGEAVDHSTSEARRLRRQGVSGQSCWCAGDLFSTIALAVALAADDEGVGVVSEAVEGRAGQQVAGEDFGPLFEGAVTGNNE